MVLPPNNLVVVKHQMQQQVSPDQRRTVQNEYALQLLQICDQIQIPKALKYRAVSLMRIFISYYPDLIFDPLRDQYLYGFLKIVLNKSDLYLTFSNESFNQNFKKISNSFVQDMQMTLKYLDSNLMILLQSPYDLLTKYGQLLMINDKISNAIQSIIDFSLSIPQTKGINAEDLFLGSFLFYFNTKQSSRQIVEKLQINFSVNVRNIAQIIQNHYEEAFA